MKTDVIHIFYLHYQVGPQVRILSERARKYGLGKSLLERLYSHYKTINSASMTKTHTSSLLTNYRCHASILMLASSLFYECTLLSQNKREAHPKASYPLVFLCTSVRQNGFSNCSPENEEEAKLLITKMIEFIQTWHSVPTEPFGLLASTKQQVINRISHRKSCNTTYCYYTGCLSSKDLEANERALHLPLPIPSGNTPHLQYSRFVKL